MLSANTCAHNPLDTTYSQLGRNRSPYFVGTLVAIWWAMLTAASVWL